MTNKKPMIKETVGAAYYAFNTPDEVENLIHQLMKQQLKVQLSKV